MDDLRLLIKSRHPILYVETQEEERLIHLLAALCRELRLAFFTWSVTQGLCRHELNQPLYDTQDPAKALRNIQAAELPAVYLLRDFHPYLKQSHLVRHLRELAQEGTGHNVTLVLSAPALELPAELRNLAARYQLELPGEPDLRRTVLETFRELNRSKNYAFRLTEDELNLFARNLKGLTLTEVRRVISRCVLDDNVLDARDLAQALAAKKHHVEQAGILEFIDLGQDLAPLGGLLRLKAWLERFQAGFSDQARRMGLRPPRGVLLVGVQGCGKSLAAKTIARAWSLPLLRLDPGRLLDKYIGESEKNLRQAFDTAEAVAPVVLWIDEIEKAFAGSTSSEADAGLSRRLFGAFLTWLQEKKETVFVAATANDLSATPPELLRKGRFDEIFFVDLPDRDARREIFSIHLTRRRQNPADYNLNALAEAADGFSGAEIEQVVVAALYGLLAEKEARLTTERLLDEIRNTVPLSRSRREYVQELRAFARDRFVPAH
ncbi:MAG: AAA family ATPase [Acidobacteria bacterium]|nr:AAA family ATPase [Acidobacteriota bacterium]